MEETKKEMNTGKDTTPLDFIGMMMLLFRKWKVLLKACFIGGIVSIIVAFSIPKEYTSTAVLAPELASGGGISSSFGSLAAMAGIDLGGISGGEDAVYPELYPQIVGSTPFLTELMELPVTTKDDKLQTDLYHYLRYHQRHPWWSVAMEAPVKLIKKLVSHNVPDTIMPSRDADPMLLSRSQQLVLKSLGKKIVTSVDKGNNVITLGVTMQDPLIAAVVAQHVSDNLQQYVADYRSAKARKDLAYTEQLFDEARDKYYAAQKAYATYADQHQNMVLLQYQIEQERLQNEQELAFNVYNQLASQLELSRAKVAESTPVCVVMQPPYTPFKASSPRKMMMGILYVFLAFFGTAAWIILREIIRGRKENQR